MLAGGGHSHALVLLQWWRRPQQRPPNSRVTLVSREPRTLYSGLVPALLAGRVTWEEASIDLQRLCRLAGVTFRQAEIIGLDPRAQVLWLQDQEPLGFDLLSLDVGAVVDGNERRFALPSLRSALSSEGNQPRASAAGMANSAATAEPPGLELPIKPLEPLLARLAHLPVDRELRLRGGGAAAIELALALKARGHPCRLLLRGEGLRLGNAAAARAAERLLQQAGIALQRHATATGPADLICTGSRAPTWLAAAGLPVQAHTGRVLTEPSLQVQGHPQLFACGDCGLVAAQPRPAAGVWAVRAADTLARNLCRRLLQPPQPLSAWRPPPRALQLLGDPGATPRAIAWWGPLSWGPSAWLWSWKQRIDRRFVASFDQLTQV